MWTKPFNLSPASEPEELEWRFGFGKRLGRTDKNQHFLYYDGGFNSILEISRAWDKGYWQVRHEGRTLAILRDAPTKTLRKKALEIYFAYAQHLSALKLESMYSSWYEIKVLLNLGITGIWALERKAEKREYGSEETLYQNLKYRETETCKELMSSLLRAIGKVEEEWGKFEGPEMDYIEIFQRKLFYDEKAEDEVQAEKAEMEARRAEYLKSKEVQNG